MKRFEMLRYPAIVTLLGIAFVVGTGMESVDVVIDACVIVGITVFVYSTFMIIDTWYDRKSNKAEGEADHG